MQERDRLIIRLFADCGRRLSELLGRGEDNIVRSGGRAAQLKVQGKGGRERPVPIVPVLLRRLERFQGHLPQPRSCDRLFVPLRRGPLGENEPLTMSGVEQLVNVAAQRAGIGRTMHSHLLRHSWMTEMLRRGVNPAQLAVVAGASPESMRSAGSVGRGGDRASVATDIGVSVRANARTPSQRTWSKTGCPRRRVRGHRGRGRHVGGTFRDGGAGSRGLGDTRDRDRGDAPGGWCRARPGRSERRICSGEG